MFWISQKSGGKKTASSENSLAVAVQKQLTDAPDSDRDGLKDWEEQLWGTNPNNPDTDGDQAPDGEEIRLGRNPLVPDTAPKDERPNDFLTDTPLKKASGEESLAGDFDDTTLTGKIARDAFQNYIELVNLGADEASAQEQAAYLTDNLQGITSARQPIVDDFTEKDIKTGSDNSKDAIKNYINALAKITKESAKDIKESELTLLTRLVENANARESREKFEKFENYITAYNGAVRGLLALRAPENISQQHLALINALNNSAKINESFANLMKDPVSGVFAIKNYTEETERIIKTLTTLYSYGMSVGL